MAVLTTAELAAQFGMPTPAEAQAAAEAFLGPEGARRLSAAMGFTWEKWGSICLSVYLGRPLSAACSAADLHRRRLYEWFEQFPETDTRPSLQSHLEGYKDRGGDRLAAQVVAFAQSGEDPKAAQWAAERRLEAYRPAPKQVEMEVKGPQGVRVVLERGDGTVVPPPKPQNEEPAHADS